MNFSRLENKKIAILGMGYIGSHLFDYLNSLDLNIEVIPITRRNINRIESETYDYLINASGNSGDFRTELIETIESNINLNSYILKHASIKENYVYLSSTRIYGFSKEKGSLFEEEDKICDSHLELDFIYNGSKRLTESLLYNYAKKLHYNVAILRLSNVYGKFDSLDDVTLIKKLFRYMIEKRDSLSVKENRFSTKDYIYIDDALKTIVSIMSNLKQTDVYNISSGKSYSLDEIAKWSDLNITTDERDMPVYSNISNKKIFNDFKITCDTDLYDILNNKKLELE